jgi:hypothetical protein
MRASPRLRGAPCRREDCPAPEMERGLSSAGRAPAWHAGGQRFDPARLHHFISDIRPGDGCGNEIPQRSVGHFLIVRGTKVTAKCQAAGAAGSPAQGANAISKSRSEAKGVPTSVRGSVLAQPVLGTGEQGRAAMKCQAGVSFQNTPPLARAKAGALACPPPRTGYSSDRSMDRASASRVGCCACPQRRLTRGQFKLLRSYQHNCK